MGTEGAARTRHATGRARILAVAFGCIVSLALVTLAEVAACRVNLRRAEPRWSGSYTKGFFVPDGRFGYFGAPSRESTCRRTQDGRVLFDVVYRTDPVGRRVTPRETETAPTRHAVFFGCSHTFGEGVEDRDTLPAQFERTLPSFRAYNFGFCGWGPQQALEWALDPALPSQISEPEGIAVYTYLVGHEDRAVGRMSVVTSWGASMPCWDLEANGSLARRGSFASARPLRQALYEIAARSELLRAFSIDFPLRRGDDEFRLVARLLGATAREYRRGFPRDRFFVVIAPTPAPEIRILPFLNREGLRVLDYSRLYDPAAPGLFIEGDRHPTREAHRILAERLAADVGRP